MGLLEKIFPLVNETFNRNLLNTTNAIAKREDARKRKSSLADVSVNMSNYNEPFGLRLLKISLLVNGLEKPGKIFYDNTEPIP